MRILIIPLLVSFFAGPQEDDLLLRVLRDEMDRSMKRLRIEKAGPPYYLEYSVRQSDSYQVSASFGALTGQGGGRSRRLSVDLRVGDYSLDNTNFSGGGFSLQGFGRGGAGTLTVDDDYDALRHAVWLATDSSYKKAVEELEKKKAYLQENNVKDRPDDFSREEPVVALHPIQTLEMDKDRWTDTVRKLSALFRDYPVVQNSTVMFWGSAEGRWFLNNEGFRNRRGDVGFALIVMAGSQADDGMKFSDYELFAGRAEKDLPAYGAMEKAVRGLAERLTALTQAPLAEEYRGPILLEGQAAAEFFAQVLAPSLGRSHEPVGSGSSGGLNPLRERIGKRILPKFVSVVDDPTAREYNGVPLFGDGEIDDDGVKARKVTLVEKGMLKTFCMSRIPTRHVKKSNGHSRNGVGATSNLIVESDVKLGPKDLREKLIELGKDEDLKYVYVARRVANAYSSMFSSRSFMRGGGGDASLSPPILLYRLYVEDGREELARGTRFGKLTLRVLRDIEALGDDARAYPVSQGGGEVGSLVAPSVLLKEIEVLKPPQESEKPPVLKNPYFEK